MVILRIESLTDFVTELTMSIIGNSSLQHAERATILASIINRAVSVCSLDYQKTRRSAKVMMNPVQLLAQAGSACSS
jgi:hypothetical protein